MINGRLCTVTAILTLAACTDSSPTAPAVAASNGPNPAAAVFASTGFSGLDVPVAIIDPGSLRATSDRYLMRGVTVQFRLETSDPRLTGFGVVVANGNLSVVDGSGQVWGELAIDSDQSDHWTGNWHGRREPAGNQWIGEIDFLLHGTGTSDQRMLARGHETISTFTLVPTAYIGQVQGTIMTLPGR
jgi:hypothetical protein